jgi:hypothetical protein
MRHKWNYAPKSIKLMQPVLDEWNEELGIRWEDRKLVQSPQQTGLSEPIDLSEPLEPLDMTLEELQQSGVPTTVISTLPEIGLNSALEYWEKEVGMLRGKIVELQDLVRQLEAENAELKAQANGRPTTTLFRDALELTIGAMTPEERQALLRELLGASR